MIKKLAMPALFSVLLLLAGPTALASEDEPGDPCGLPTDSWGIPWGQNGWSWSSLTLAAKDVEVATDGVSFTACGSYSPGTWWENCASDSLVYIYRWWRTGKGKWNASVPTDAVGSVRTNEDGTYEVRISGVRPGRYSAMVWDDRSDAECWGQSPMIKVR